MSRHLTDCEQAEGCALDPACEDYEFCTEALKAVPFLVTLPRKLETHFLPGDEPEPDDEEGAPDAVARS